MFSFQASYFAPKRANIRYCQNEFTAGCAHIIIKESLRQLVNGKFPGCEIPCVQENYKFSQFSLKQWENRVYNTSRYWQISHLSNIMVYFKSEQNFAYFVYDKKNALIVTN